MNFLRFRMCRKECSKPSTVLKVKQTSPVDTDLRESPNSFQHILLQKNKHNPIKPTLGLFCALPLLNLKKREWPAADSVVQAIM